MESPYLHRSPDGQFVRISITAVDPMVATCITLYEPVNIASEGKQMTMVQAEADPLRRNY